MYQYHTWLLIGRFQPPHRGHGDMISQYLHSRCQHHIIGIGSPYCHPSMTNPFDYETRKTMLQTVIDDIPWGNTITICPVDDYESDIQWIEMIMQTICPDMIFSGNPRVHQCAAHMSIVCISPEVRIDISATQIRNARYENRLSDVSDNLHPYIYKHLINHSPWSLWLWQDVVLNISDEFV